MGQRVDELRWGRQTSAVQKGALTCNPFPNLLFTSPVTASLGEAQGVRHKRDPGGLNGAGESGRESNFVGLSGESGGSGLKEADWPLKPLMSLLR